MVWKRLHALGFRTYAKYLLSDHWADFRIRYFASGKPKTCTRCSYNRVQLHHITYIRLGAESLDDVIPLCSKCHEKVHRWLKRRKLPVSDTLFALQCLSVSQKEAKELQRKRAAKKARAERSKGGRMMGNVAASNRIGKRIYGYCTTCGRPARKGTYACKYHGPEAEEPHDLGYSDEGLHRIT